MMPPSAKAIGSHSGDATPTGATNWSTQVLPIFSSGVVDDSQAEVAKKFHWREFGNGAANGGAGSGYADASMFTVSGDEISFFMDDGLTSFSGEDMRHNGNLYHHDTGGIHLTFIGTGLSFRQPAGFTGPDSAVWAQNLPYGTHVLKIEKFAAYGASNGEDHKLTLDGVVIMPQLVMTHGSTGVPYLGDPEFGFYQPKMPPIPEDAVVIADYMLMADFVPSTVANTAGHISKGVRFVSASRDVWYNSGAAITYNAGYTSSMYGTSIYNNNGTSEGRIVGFGSGFGCHYLRDTNREGDIMVRLDGANYTETGSNEYDTGVEWDSHSDGAITKDGTNGWNVYGIKNQTLGVHTFGDKKLSGSDYNAWSGFEIASPIHTSSHYQPFETPFLHELVGGDRNMEQNNLVVTPDGKTWDQLRDTSYMGPSAAFYCTEPQDTGGAAQDLIFTNYRGTEHGAPNFAKNFAIAYDRLICLEDGFYYIKYQTIENTGSTNLVIKVNNTQVIAGHSAAVSWVTGMASTSVQLKRGDTVRMTAANSENMGYCNFLAYKIG